MMMSSAVNMVMNLYGEYGGDDQSFRSIGGNRRLECGMTAVRVLFHLFGEGKLMTEN
jgi:hypothetical protein